MRILIKRFVASEIFWTWINTLMLLLNSLKTGFFSYSQFGKGLPNRIDSEHFKGAHQFNEAKAIEFSHREIHSLLIVHWSSDWILFCFISLSFLPVRSNGERECLIQQQSDYYWSLKRRHLNLASANANSGSTHNLVVQSHVPESVNLFATAQRHCSLTSTGSK